MRIIETPVLAEVGGRKSLPFYHRATSRTCDELAKTMSFAPGLRELYGYRAVLAMWIVRDIKVRYKQSLLGMAWAVLQPASAMLVFTVIFSAVVRVPTDGVPYPLFSYSALMIWTLLVTSLTTGVPSVVNNMNLVTKVYFPREILPISAVVASVVDFGAAAGLLPVLLLVFGSTPSPALLSIPFILAVELLLIVGLVLGGAALNVFYRDVRFIIPVATQLWMYLTPVIYPLALIPAQYRAVYMLNPMAGIVESYRRALLFGQFPEVSEMAPATLISVAVFILGYGYFKRAERRFADLI